MGMAPGIFKIHISRSDLCSVGALERAPRVKRTAPVTGCDRVITGIHWESYLSRDARRM